MSMEKITPDSPEAQSADLVAENIEKLKALFPELVTEGPEGLSVNVDLLKALVGDQTVTDCAEKYGLNWFGKRRARQLALTPSTGTLRPAPEESEDWDTTQNLFIEGDNLEVLKLLQKSYAGKVKLIYIDPPYNTGKDFIYKDDFRDNIRNYKRLTGQVDEEGSPLTTNTEASGRFHTDWLNMIYPRLKLARNLLGDDGAIFISIDDREAPNLRKLLDEIFGEENFVSQFSWRTDGNFDNQAKVKICHEYILLYAKSLDEFPHPPAIDPNTPADSKLYNPEIRNTIIKNGPKNPPSKVCLPKGFPASFESGKILSRPKPWPIYHTNAVIRDYKLDNDVIVESGWSSKNLLVEFIENNFRPIKDNKGQETSFVITESGAIEVIKKRTDYQSHVISVLSGFGGPQKAAALLTNLGVVFNGYPKPVDLIQYFVRMIYGKQGIFLDFFAGSGTTGHAVMAQNVKDGGNRRYILVQLPEPLDPEKKEQKTAAEYCDKLGKPRTIAELTKERLRRAAKKIKEEHPDWNGDTGFRVFKLDSSNIKAWNPQPDDVEAQLEAFVDHIEEGRTEADLLYELLLKLGLDLCVPIEQKEIASKAVHAIGGGVLMTCLAEKITTEETEALGLGIVEWHKELASAGDTTCVFLDSAFENDVAKTNLAAILEQAGIANVRSL